MSTGLCVYMLLCVHGVCRYYIQHRHTYITYITYYSVCTLHGTRCTYSRPIRICPKMEFACLFNVSASSDNRYTARIWRWSWRFAPTPFLSATTATPCFSSNAAGPTPGGRRERRKRRNGVGCGHVHVHVRVHAP